MIRRHPYLSSAIIILLLAGAAALLLSHKSPEREEDARITGLLMSIQDRVKLGGDRNRAGEDIGKILLQPGLSTQNRCRALSLKAWLARRVQDADSLSAACREMFMAPALCEPFTTLAIPHSWGECLQGTIY